VAGLNLVIWRRSRILKVLSDDLNVLFPLEKEAAAPWTTTLALAEAESSTPGSFGLGHHVLSIFVALFRS
jgi:hypothetical protein